VIQIIIDLLVLDLTLVTIFHIENKYKVFTVYYGKTVIAHI